MAEDASGIALVTLVVLRLTGVVSWSWWWVLSPLWLSGVLMAAVLCVLLALLALRLRRRRLPVLQSLSLGHYGRRYLRAWYWPARSSRMGAPKAALEWHGSTLPRRTVGILARDRQPLTAAYRTSLAGTADPSPGHCGLLPAFNDKS